MKKRIFLTLFLFLLVFLLYPKSSDTISVTIKPLELIVGEIVGNSVNVNLIVPPGSSPHTFQLTIKDAVKLNKSDALIMVGAGLELWLNRVEKNFKKKQRLFKFSDYFSNFIGSGSRVNPHLWLSSKRVIKIIPELVKFLIKIYPENKAIFEKNSKNLIKEIEETDKYIELKLNKIRNKKVVMYHPVWAYFLQDYKIKSIATIERKPGESPSPKWVVEIIKKIKGEKVKVIIGEPNVSDKWVKMIAEATGANVVILDPLGFSKKIKKYYELIKFNADLLMGSLQ